jgi:pimeloyl-ACP methyl ester carboxylesterase
MTSSRVELDGASVAYLREGEGPPLVLLHGDGESRLGWQAVMPRLAERWDVIAPDLPGFADSRLGGEPTPERLAASVAELLQHLGVGPAPIIGNSLGGMVAVLLARAVPHQVRGLVLADPAGMGVVANPVLSVAAYPGLGELNAMTAALPLAGFARAEARRLLLFAEPRRAPDWWRAEMVRLSRPDVVATSVASRRATLAPWGQRRLVLQELPEVTVPTLVVWGRDDLVFPLAQGRVATDRLPDGRLAVIPGCGHLPHVERPDRFLAEVEPFLAGLPPVPGEG